METGRQALGMAVLRVAVGIVFVMHGKQKLFEMGFQHVGAFMHSLGIPLSQVAGVAVPILEFFGGLALLLGLFTRWIAILLACDMLVAMLAVHLKHGFFGPGGVEFVLTLLAANIALALSGPGAAGLDGLLARRRAR